MENDYGRQLIMKGGLGTYSAGWAAKVDLPDSTGSQDYRWNIENCNVLPVGIAKSTTDCSKCKLRHSGIYRGRRLHKRKDRCFAGSNKRGHRQRRRRRLWRRHWGPSAPGPDGQLGGVVGGQGNDSPRIRPIVIIDINNYISQSCSGTTCVGKIANIIGFFTEGMCKDVTLDPGYSCPDPNKDVVGRIMIPGSYASGVGSVQNPSSFVEIVRLVR